ncbi:FAD binding domain-containing protein [Syncephalis pseudoplumigaleata]|uniref:FAD binding domain-containing protein n=1 Tax=Syncephalis pseudoplumigaleata TaxID=1712513 RepID=A0A4P9Z2P8_9FUNG|nr:FAD binding domain-containing protein [Syncephalis pseudoplumigaleata]|eukprot:RKP26774.1 FAD binding domain-containing protein [Syncephalis pseudoplumigaleata]
MVTAPFYAMNAMEERDPVLIIGSGPTGLMAALILTELGVPVEVYDKSPKPASTWRAPGFNARTMELFARYGLAERFSAVSEPRNELTVYAEGKQIAQLSLYGARTEFPHLFLCPQTETERVLRERLAELGVYIQWGWEFTGYDMVTPSAGTGRGKRATAAIEAVAARFQCAEMELHHRPRTIVRRGAYLLGCDGAHSRVRKAMGAAFGGRRIDTKIAAGDVEVDADWPNAGRFSLHPDGMVGALRVKGSHCYRVFAAWGENDPAELTNETFAATLRHRLAPEPLANLNVISTSLFTLQERRASYYSIDGRIFLCGDAAHIHSPAGGQGLNLGVQDAENIAWKLALVYHGRANAKLLDTYAIERVPVANDVIELSHNLFSKTMASTSSMRAFLLKHTAPFLASAPRKLQRKRFEQAAQLRIRYSADDNVAVDEDGCRWENAWWSSLLTDDLCVPGARAVDGVVTDMAAAVDSQPLRVRQWLSDHCGNYAVMVFVDCGVAAVEPDLVDKSRAPQLSRAHSSTSLSSVAASSISSSYRGARLARTTIDELMMLLAVLRGYVECIPLAIILHGSKQPDTQESVAQQIFEHFPAAYDSSFDDAPSPLIRVFADQPQGMLFDGLALSGIYACAHSGKHVAYLVRPDGYIACRGPLAGAGDQVQTHLDSYIYYGK